MAEYHKGERVKSKVLDSEGRAGTVVRQILHKTSMGEFWGNVEIKWDDDTVSFLHPSLFERVGQ